MPKLCYLFPQVRTTQGIVGNHRSASIRSNWVAEGERDFPPRVNLPKPHPTFDSYSSFLCVPQNREQGASSMIHPPSSFHSDHRTLIAGEERGFPSPMTNFGHPSIVHSWSFSSIAVVAAEFHPAPSRFIEPPTSPKKKQEDSLHLHRAWIISPSSQLAQNSNVFPIQSNPLSLAFSSSFLSDNQPKQAKGFP